MVKFVLGEGCLWLPSLSSSLHTLPNRNLVGRRHAILICVGNRGLRQYPILFALVQTSLFQVFRHHLRMKNMRQAKALNSLQKVKRSALIRALIWSPDLLLKKFLSNR